MLRPPLGPIVEAELAYRRTPTSPTRVGVWRRPSSRGLLRHIAGQARLGGHVRLPHRARVPASAASCTTS